MRTDASYDAVTGSEQTGIAVITGFNFAETAGAVARVLLRDGGAAGTIVADLHLGASQSVGESFDYPVHLTGKCYVDVAAGAVRGAVYGR